MTAATDDIIQALKVARLRKGLSQRALSARSGVPQSHISRIERGAVDIQLSSLVELARALGLELKLVPRKAVPAVDSVVRTTAPAIDAKNLAEIQRIAAAAKASLERFHNLPEAKRLAEIAKSSQEAINQLDPKILQSLLENQKIIEQLGRHFQQGSLPTETKIRPAYRLDDDEEDGDA